MDLFILSGRVPPSPAQVPKSPARMGGSTSQKYNQKGPAHTGGSPAKIGCFPLSENGMGAVSRPAVPPVAGGTLGVWRDYVREGHLLDFSISTRLPPIRAGQWAGLLKAPQACFFDITPLYKGIYIDFEALWPENK